MNASERRIQRTSDFLNEINTHLSGYSSVKSSLYMKNETLSTGFSLLNGSNSNFLVEKENQIFQTKLFDYLLEYDITEENIGEKVNNISQNKFFFSLTRKPLYYKSYKQDRRVVTTVINTKKLMNVGVPESLVINDGVFKNNRFLCKKSNYERIVKRISLDSDENDPLVCVSDFLVNDICIVKSSNNFQRKETLDKKNSLILDFCQPYLFTNSDLVGSRVIVVNIEQIKFLYHPFISSQIVLKNKLVSVYNLLKNEVQKRSIESFYNQIIALRYDLADASSINKKHEILLDLKEIYDKKEFAEQRLNELRETLVLTWNELKTYEEEFSTFPYVLRWNTIKKTEDEILTEKIKFERDIQSRAEEIKCLSDIEGSESDTIELIAEKLRKRHVELRIPDPGTPFWDPVLKPVDIDEKIPTSSNERKRRMNIDATSYNFVIKVGNAIAVTESFKMDYDLNTYVQLLARVKCSKVPRSAIVEVWESFGGAKRLIGRVNMIIVNGIPSELVEISFTSPSVGSNGELVQGCLIGNAYLEPDFECQNTSFNSYVLYNRAKDMNRMRPLSFLSTQKIANSMRSYDPNCPYLREVLLKTKTVIRDPRKEDKFRLDHKVNHATELAFHAPTDIAGLIYKNSLPNYERPVEKLSLNRVVIEKRYSFHDLLRNFLGIFGRKRPLKPEPVFEIYTDDLSMETLFLTKLFSCKNYPYRKLKFPEESALRLVHSERDPSLFIRITISDFSQISDLVYNPPYQWNESFAYVFYNCFLNQTTEEMKKTMIKIDLFDHIEFLYHENDGFSINSYLGSLEIPVMSLIINKKIHGVIPVSSNTFSMSYNNINDISLDFQMKFNPLVHFDIPTLKENSTYATGFPNDYRHILYVKDNSETITPITYFLNACNPPEYFTTIKACLRFASLIKFEDSGPSDVLVIREIESVVNNMSGNKEEHCIYLAGCILFLGYDSYVVLCYDRIYGPTALVYVRDKEILLDPYRCKIYDIHDTKCPYFNIGAIFNDYYVYSNVQEFGEPFLMNWNFDESTSFKVQKFNRSTHVVDNIQLTYSEVNKKEAKSLRRLMQQTLVNCVLDLRESETQWNDSLSSELKKILIGCENKEILEGSNTNLDDLVNNFHASFPQYMVHGSPFFIKVHRSDKNFEFALDKLRSEIISKEVFFNSLPGVSFSSSILVFPYPNGSYVVWILFVSIIDLLLKEEE